jgi:hypothetical protein
VSIVVRAFGLSKPRSSKTILLTSKTTHRHTTKEGDKYWKFSFCISHDGSFSNGDDPTGLLKESVTGVPMITGLDETYKEGFLMPYLIATGDNPNIYFDLVQDTM